MKNELHPVLKLIQERYVSRSVPGNRKDEFKLGLAIEGGGMRGVVATAMASALHYLGLVNVFDAVYGSSAGALSGTFFVTYKMPLGPTIFYDNINNNKFIGLRRLFLKNKNIMNLDFLIYNVLVNEKPMNWKGVINSKIPLNTVVSSINQRKAISFNKYESRKDLFTLLKASANIPFIAGPPVKYKGDLLFDASVYESIPYKIAISDGCTHVLALLTRPFGRLPGRPSFLEKHVIAKKMRKLKVGLDEDYLIRTKKYKEFIEFLHKSNIEFLNPPYIYSIYPSKNEEEVSRLEKNRKKIVKGSISGMKAVMEVFSQDKDIKYHEVICPVNNLGLIPKIKIGA